MSEKCASTRDKLKNLPPLTEASYQFIRRMLDKSGDTRSVEEAVESAMAMVDPTFTPEEAERMIEQIMAMNQHVYMEGDNGVRSISKEEMIADIRRRTVYPEEDK